MREPAQRARTLRFSSRTEWDTTETAWAALLRQKRASGDTLYDLTAANPTDCGFAYAEDLFAPLSNPLAFAYDPDPRSLLTAREAVCAYYREHQRACGDLSQLTLTPHRLFLTTSTSEAYSFLLRLLCDPGDQVLIAQPSYPLFDFLAEIGDIQLVPYPLFYDFGWHLDTHGLREKITPRTRALVVVHPNNPTGHYTSPVTRKALEDICVEFGLALIVDEVFLDYSFSGTRPSFVQGEHPALTFVLSGLSKVAGLPQMKVSWIACCGPEGLLEDAAGRLEVISDTFLSVSTPQQYALAPWLGGRHSLQEQISMRTQKNLAVLDELLATTPLFDRLQIEGGWYAILRVPAIRDGESAALDLLRMDNVVIHPGQYFGMPAQGWFVVSLLSRPESFRCGVKAALGRLSFPTSLINLDRE